MRNNDFQIYFRMCVCVSCQHVHQIIFGLHVIVYDFFITEPKPLQNDGRHNTGAVLSGRAEIQYMSTGVHDGIHDALHLFIHHLPVDRIQMRKRFRRIASACDREVNIPESGLSGKAARFLGHFFIGPQVYDSRDVIVQKPLDFRACQALRNITPDETQSACRKRTGVSCRLQQRPHKHTSSL